MNLVPRLRQRLRPLARRIRDGVNEQVVRALCAAGPLLFGAPRIAGIHVARVLGGPLRGSLLAMPTLQRTSFVLGSFEPHVVRAMQAHVRPGSVAYDVGANIGYLTLMLGKLVGPGGTVIAFEPTPRDRTVLEHNIKLNGLSQVRVIESALAEQAGTLQFATFDYSGISHLAGDDEPDDAMILTVPVTTLDDLIFAKGSPPPAFMKIDVEGAELRVLQGGQRMLGTYQPAIVCEVRWHGTYEPICALLAAHGYTSRVLWRGMTFGDVLFTATSDASA